MWTWIIKFLGCAAACWIVLQMMVKFKVGQSVAYVANLANGATFSITWAVGICLALFLVSMVKINAKWS